MNATKYSESYPAGKVGTEGQGKRFTNYSVESLAPPKNFDLQVVPNPAHANDMKSRLANTYSHTRLSVL